MFFGKQLQYFIGNYSPALPSAPMKDRGHPFDRV